MEKGYHQIPILEFEGKNLEEKESRHDLDTKLTEDKGTRNANPKQSCLNLS